MNNTLWTSKNKKWIIKREGDSIIILEDEFYSYSPVVYDNGNIGYNNPFRIPKYVQQQYKKIVNKNN